MKKQTTGLFIPISKENLVSLTTQVNEVLDTDYKKRDNLALSSADLWDIRRRQKLRLKRRYF